MHAARDASASFTSSLARHITTFIATAVPPASIAYTSVPSAATTTSTPPVVPTLAIRILILVSLALGFVLALCLYVVNFPPHTPRFLVLDRATAAAAAAASSISCRRKTQRRSQIKDPELALDATSDLKKWIEREENVEVQLRDIPAPRRGGVAAEPGSAVSTALSPSATSTPGLTLAHSFRGQKPRQRLGKRDSMAPTTGLDERSSAAPAAAVGLGIALDGAFGCDIADAGRGVYGDEAWDDETMENDWERGDGERFATPISEVGRQPFVTRKVPVRVKVKRHRGLGCLDEMVARAARTMARMWDDEGGGEDGGSRNLLFPPRP